MTHTPPIPEAAQSIYPIEEAPHDHVESEALEVARELAAAKERRSSNSRHIGLGAAIGVGSAAIVAGLLYWRGGRRS